MKEPGSGQIDLASPGCKAIANNSMEEVKKGERGSPLPVYISLKIWYALTSPKMHSPTMKMELISAA
jgi:hypothetical protein